MNNITALTQEMTHGGKLERGYITRRVLVTHGHGGDWYKLEMTNEHPTRRTITARREDSTIGYPVTERDARTWQHRLEDARERRAA